MSAIAALIEVYYWVVIVSVIGSWVRSDNAIFRFADSLVDPVLEPIRKVIPPAGGFDLSPLVLIFGLYFLKSLLH